MAVRRTILVIGDLTAAGQISVSALTSINASYADVQTDFEIWDTQDQAWEQLEPGVNSNPTTAATDFWGVESRLRAEMSTYFPSGTLYCIKHALDASLFPNGTNGDWDPSGAGNAYADLFIEVATAAAAADAAGDTLSIDGIIVSVQSEDFKRTGWKSYVAGIEALIDQVRGTLATVPSCAVGTFRNDGGLTPVVVMEPHYGYTGLTAGEANQLVSCRALLQQIENDDNRIVIGRAHSYNPHTDGKTYDAQSMVEQAADVVARWYPRSYDDGANPERRVVGLLGDSTMEGWLTDNTQLPAHQQAALTGANIWRPETGGWSTLEAGVNNLISVPSTPFTGHGVEISLGDRMRALGNTYFVKGSQINSTASDARTLIGAETPPHGQRTFMSWSQGRGQLSDMHVRGNLIAAIERLRRQNFKPVLDLVVISVGLNDCNAAGIPSANASNVIHAVNGLINQIKKLASDLDVKTSGIKFVVCVPPEWAIDAVDPFSADATRLGTVRQDLLAMPTTQQDVHVIDYTDHEAGQDSYHPSTGGVKTIADAIWDIFNSSSAIEVEPMFSPTMDYLRSALRLSNLADTNDAVDMIDQAVLHARTRFFRELGETRINALKAIAFTKDPSTQDQYFRTMAVDTEIKIVRAQLMRVMPMSFMDGMAPQQVWNEEAAFRESGYLQMKDELRRHEEEIIQNMDMLLTADLTKYSGDVEAFGSEDGDSPGESVFGTI